MAEYRAMITECEVNREALRIMPVVRSTSLSPRTREKDIAKRSSSSPAAMLRSRLKLPLSSLQQNLSASPSSSDDSVAAAITSSTNASLSMVVKFPESSPQSRRRNELCDSEQDINMSEEGVESEVNEERESNSIRDFFFSVPFVADDPSDSDKEKYVPKKR